MFLKAKELSKIYPKSANHQKVLDELNINLKFGELVCLMGPSGAGKTTLFQVLAGLTKVDSGSITVFQHGETLGVDELRFGMIFKEENLFDDFKVKGNLKIQSYLARMKQAHYKTRVELIVKRYALDGLLDLYPEKLSSSQRKWVALAKADLIEPDYFFADQPTLNMTPKLKTSFMERLKSLARSSGALVVTNDISCASFADRLFYMDGGKIVDELMLDQEDLLVEREALVYSWLKGKGY
ncbi:MULTISPECIES: ATP-binding cassette domain-containing protein [unclassified Fusibacter]|uniref:ATP-binding cassette domain-containing protein n=1 Tax=unclassified Fusibacter TaxID=2624464 RepID=UPI001012CE81|nr:MULTISPECIES: ATP-binding cassette domain-containing protein [unclassified Fusibacter]MCK8059897.1 ATP-binding cassette domain-containing protein [Fusibacter sp. A2]NPE23895.1 ATP-binding cassette domain-containing protein [Fusibacter sp. A1]RXV58475.1 ATP-binding cassette domain-containing protein [Fusibacter sp. A1]